MPDETIKQEENQEKEVFDVGLTDDELFIQFKDWFTESDSFYTFLERVIKENLEYYKGNQTDVNKIHGKQSRAVENRIFMATETVVPIATSRLPDIDVVSNDETEAGQLEADQLQSVLNYHMERLGVQEMSEKFVRDMLLKRFGCFHVFWDADEDDVGLELVDPKRLRFPKYGSCVYDLKFIIREKEISYSQAKEFFGEDKAKKLKNDQSSAMQKIRKENLIVYEVWTNEYVCWFSGSGVIEKKPNPNFDFKNPGKNYFTKARKPFIIKSLFQTEESLVGDTDHVQQLKPIQDNINIRKRQIENIIRKVANPMLLLDSGVMSEEEASNITNEEGFILYGKDAASGTKIRFEQPGNVPAYMFEDLQFSRTEFDNIWGVHSTTRGERQGKETLGGRQLLKAADLGRIDLVARQLERALDEIAEYWTQLIKLFYTEDRSFSILGPEGVVFIKGFTGDKVGDIRLIVKTGSTLPKDEVMIHEEAKELWGLKAIGVKTLYKMLKLPNIGEAIADFKETNQPQAVPPPTAIPPIQ